ncbi:MAG: universal stress protein, partial [Nitrospiraceae bacterium]
ETYEANAYLRVHALAFAEQGITAHHVIRTGNTADEIVDYATVNQIDLIAMSTHGRTGLSRALLGSVAEKVVRHSPVPVLLVSAAGGRQ